MRRDPKARGNSIAVEVAESAVSSLGVVWTLQRTPGAPRYFVHYETIFFPHLGISDTMQNYQGCARFNSLKSSRNRNRIV